MSFPQTKVVGDSVSEDLHVDILVEVIEEFSKHSPCCLKIRFINKAPNERNFYFGFLTPFTPAANENSDKRSLCLMPNKFTGEKEHEMYSSLIPDAPQNDCWRLNDEFFVPLSETVVALKHGEEISNTYAVLSTPMAEDCLSEGEYRFEWKWGLENQNSEEKNRHRWGFNLEIH